MSVYFIQAVNGGPIKIGTTICLSERLKQLSKEAGRTLQVIAVVDGGETQEKRLHKRFSDLRVVGEWFDPGADLLDFLSAEGKPWDGVDDIPKALKQKAILVYKADEQTLETFKAWLEGLAEHLGAPVTVTVDIALKRLAEQQKYKPMPKRLVR